MSYETMALEGYYVKSGVPESEAHLIASQFGQFFVRLQAKKRQEGHGNKSKALAALEVADYIFFYASVREEHELWANIRSKKDIESLIKVVRADLSPEIKTMTLMRFPINLTGWRSHNEETLHRRTDY